jgi:hypothetical protein
MKKFLIGLAGAIVCNSICLAADPNTAVMNVTQMKGVWAADSASTIYFYKFDNWSLSTCSPDGWAKSGDPNINELLRVSYITGVSIRAGIVSHDPTDCIVTTVELQPPS